MHSLQTFSENTALYEHVRRSTNSILNKI